MKWDAVIVGAGTAGLPTALFAADRGKRVLVVDKADDIGGTLWLSGGQMSAAGTRLQAAKGIEDTADEHFDDIVHMSHGTCDRELTRLAVDEAATTVDWLEDIGFEFSRSSPAESYGNVHEPYSKARMHWGDKLGISQLDVLRPQFEERLSGGNVELRLGASVADLIVEDGAVTGVKLQGADHQTASAPVVVLASGGYVANPSLFADRSGARLVSGGMPTSTGDGILMAERHGAEFRNGHRYLPTFGGIEDPDQPHFAIPWQDWPLLVPQMRDPWELYVDRAGKRFVAEDEPDVATREAAVLALEEQTFWIIFDEEVLESAPPLVPSGGVEGLRAWASEGRFAHTADTLEGLALSAGVDPAGLAVTVKDYNMAVSAGDDAMGRTHLPRPIERPPFYALENHGTTLRTPGGLRINDSLEVVRTDGTSIKGLYAAGEIIGGATFGGTGYAAGMSVTPAMSFGRLIGSAVI